MTTASIPLWQALLTGGGLALAGVLLKAVLDWITERRRWAREDRVMHHESRREAYTSYLAITFGQQPGNADEVRARVLVLGSDECVAVASRVASFDENATTADWRSAFYEFLQAARRDLGIAMLKDAQDAPPDPPGLDA